jgi:SHS2 domain-containing protein
VYQWVDHTSELELAVEASSEAAVFVEALAAFRELLGDEGQRGEIEHHELMVASRDRSTLFADFLAELVFLAETEDFVPERVSTLAIEPTRLRAVVEGRRGEPRHLVKAVTYHGLEFANVDGRWRARVVLDV